jgi:hypothetical protein
VRATSCTRPNIAGQPVMHKVKLSRTIT